MREVFCLFIGVFFSLQAEHIGVFSVLLHKLIVAAAFNDPAVFDKLQQKLEEQNLLNEAREEPMCRLRKNIGRNKQGSTFADCFQ